MNDSELDRLIAAAASATTAEVRGWDLAAAEADLIEEIMSTDLTSPAGSAPHAPPGDDPIAVDIDITSAGGPAGTRTTSRLRRRRRLVPAVAAAAVAAVVVAGAVVALSDDPTDVEQEGTAPVAAPGSGATGAAAPTAPAYPAEDVTAAEALPHLVVDLPGWSAAAVYAAARDGEHPITPAGASLDFAHGDQVLRLVWLPAALHQSVLDHIPAASTRPVTVAGHDATLFVFDDQTPEGSGPDGSSTDTAQVQGNVSDHAAVWLQDDYVIEVRGSGFGFGETQAFEDALAGLAETDTTTWMDAVSPVVVWPSARASTVDAMLADLPRPAGLDPAAFAAGTGIGSRRAFGVEVTRAVTCGWIGSWVAAGHAGDTAAVQAAVAALATAHDWDVLVDMGDDGWPGAVWGYADAVATGAPVPAGSPDVTVEESYQEALGC
ncbi:MAG TPA: hypothetical protein VGO78_30045 [Acidimicrobiales bacterium]|nr:hypothetical protein [Acidimicrobiales bacterium]